MNDLKGVDKMEDIKQKWGLPPIEKVHEAYSAVVDERVDFFENYATVSSSDRKKKYTVRCENNDYSSNDNASYWQGYLGYPLIAVLMLQGKLTYNKDVASLFKNINWKTLNTKHKNNYSKVVGIIMDDFAANGVDIATINQDVDSVYHQIKNLDIGFKRSKLPPPR